MVMLVTGSCNLLPDEEMAVARQMSGSFPVKCRDVDELQSRRHTGGCGCVLFPCVL